MLIYTDVREYRNMPFIDYMKLPAYSHSYFRNERGGVPGELLLTENMRIGGLVDAILMQPELASYSDPLYEAAKAIAYDITKQWGKTVKHFITQPSYTAIMHHGEFSMPVKGRPDWVLPNLAVIDLKITKSRYIKELIAHMNYKNSIWHYCKLAGVKRGYLLMHSLAIRKTQLIPVDCSSDENDFWRDRVFLFGKVETKAS
jgi:hypothetical protein